MRDARKTGRWTPQSERIASHADRERGWVDLDDLSNGTMVELALLNGADGWPQYSEGGCSLIYDPDIAERLCTPSELKKNRHGDRNPNSWETWLQCQARALHQAANRIRKAFASCRHLLQEEERQAA